MLERIVLLFVFLPTVILAQDMRPSAVESNKGILIRFTAFGTAELPPQFVLRSDKSIGPPFEIPGNGFSMPIEVSNNSRNLQLGSSPEGQNPFSALVGLKLPDQGRRFLVILFPSPGGLKTTVMRADDPEFQRGDIKIFNLSPQTLAGDLGGDRLQFAPGSTTVFHPKRKGEAPTYQVSFYYRPESTVKLFAANMWPYFNHKRAFVFLYVDPATSRPTYRSVDEFTEWLDTPGG